MSPLVQLYRSSHLNKEYVAQSYKNDIETQKCLRICQILPRGRDLLNLEEHFRLMDNHVSYRKTGPHCVREILVHIPNFNLKKLHQ